VDPGGRFRLFAPVSWTLLCPPAHPVMRRGGRLPVLPPREHPPALPSPAVHHRGVRRDTAEYLGAHNIKGVLHEIVERVCVELPADPIAFMRTELGRLQVRGAWAAAGRAWRVQACAGGGRPRARAPSPRPLWHCCFCCFKDFLKTHALSSGACRMRGVLSAPWEPWLNGTHCNRACPSPTCARTWSTATRRGRSGAPRSAGL
jgi:hypothetical protein